MKQFYTLSILILFGSLSIAQTRNNPCGFDRYTNDLSILDAERIIQNGVMVYYDDFALRTSHDSIKIIPIVIHVIHEGGNENISVAQINSQIQIINEDFGKIIGSNGDGSGVDTKVRFKLAQIDPEGNCTNGIVRINSSLTNHKTFERAMLKELSFWDNTMYMNIYLVKSINGSVLGYSSFPGGPPEEDGMVIRSNVFGNIGTASSQVGRTATHEIGHWFGLYHTFNNGCGTDVCTDGDYVCDTPPQALPSFNCNDINSCANDSPDINDQKENYMNYTPGTCKNMLTEGQKLRVQSTLQNIRTIIWSDANLIATGTDSNYTTPSVCGVTANFVTLTPTVCVENDVRFIDVSLNNATSWQWFFQGGVPTISTDQNPVITYNNIGVFSVKLIVSDSFSTDTIEMLNAINVITPGVGQPIPYYENFDSGIFPPQGITIANNDGGITWELDSNASVSGDYSVRINNLINTNYGSADEIILPDFNFSTYTGNILLLKFNYAYARSDPSFSDDLVILLSTDCGVTFKSIRSFSGNILATGPTQTTPFIPDSTQWKEAIVFLDQYRAEEYVQLKIVNVTDGGNNLYIDDINLGDFPVGINNVTNEAKFSFFPNPASNTLTINFADKSESHALRIYNSIGSLVLSKDLGLDKQISVSTQNLPNGVYFLEITNGKNISTKKLIISKYDSP